MSKEHFAFLGKRGTRGALGAAAALALLGVTAPAFAGPPVTMAPPTQPAFTQDMDGTPVNAGPDSTFQWTEIPQDQKVPLTRAVFDQNGYQLYDTAGETVVVPFTNNNLYVMKFAPSDDGTLYLVNEGDVPVLYVPRGAFLENASVPGARWYPFPDDFRPARPVFLGVAPSWSAFVSIGWAPDVVIRGGYWGRTSFISGGVFLPSAGLAFEIGGRRYSGWEPYHAYVVAHPDHFRFGYVDRGYHARTFRGAGSGYAHDGERTDSRSYRAGDRDYRGADRPADRGGRAPRVFRGARGDFRRDRDRR